MIDELVAVYGKHACVEALRMRPDIIKKAFTLEGHEDPSLFELIKKAKLSPTPFTERRLPRGVPPGAVHQGVVLLMDSSKLLIPYETYIQTLKVTEHTALVILGEVQDPHNVGAVIRSAAAFGVSGVIIPEHRQAPLTGTVLKVSAGMAFKVPLLTIGNVNQTVRDLKDRGFWIYGLEGTAEVSLTDENFEKPSVFILGNEATGIREKTLELCDIPLRIPMHAGAESLNAAASAAVALYAWSAKHPKALK